TCPVRGGRGFFWDRAPGAGGRGLAGWGWGVPELLSRPATPGGSERWPTVAVGRAGPPPAKALRLVRSGLKAAARAAMAPRAERTLAFAPSSRSTGISRFWLLVPNTAVGPTATALLIWTRMPSRLS